MFKALYNHVNNIIEKYIFDPKTRVFFGFLWRQRG